MSERRIRTAIEWHDPAAAILLTIREAKAPGARQRRLEQALDQLRQRSAG